MAEICPRKELLGYVAWHVKAERMHKVGVKQEYCETCSKWTFPEEQCDRFQSEPHR